MSPAAPMAFGLLAAALGYDVWLVKHQHETISSFIRRSGWRKAVAVYLAVHLCVAFKFDPLHLIGERFK